jgi:hypothetical protein
MLLIGRTPAARRRACIQAGESPTVTSATAAAYRGQSSGFSIAVATSICSTGFSDIRLSPGDTGAGAAATGAATGLATVRRGNVRFAFGCRVAPADDGASHLEAVRRGHFARDADDRHAVRPVRGDLEVDDRIVAERVDPFDGESADGHRCGDVLRRARDVDEFAQPRKKDLHRLNPSDNGKLLQKSEVVLVEHPDVLDAVLEHRDALHAEAEREATDLLRVVADRLEDGRMHHAAAEDLEPAGALADAAAGARRSGGS